MLQLKGNVYIHVQVHVHIRYMYTFLHVQCTCACACNKRTCNPKLWTNMLMCELKRDQHITHMCLLQLHCLLLAWSGAVAKSMSPTGLTFTMRVQQAKMCALLCETHGMHNVYKMNTCARSNHSVH